MIKTYRVTGYAMMPVQAEIFVDASSQDAALERAELAFKADETKRRFIIKGSEDETAIHSFRASNATVSSG
jgi:hypothetical protein